MALLVTRSNIRRDDCALRFRDGLLAGEAVIGAIGLTRTRESSDGRLHRQPPLAEVLLSGRNRIRRRLPAHQSYNGLWGRSSGAQARLKLGTDFDPMRSMLAAQGVARLGDVQSASAAALSIKSR